MSTQELSFIAKRVVHHSLEIQKGEKVLIDVEGDAEEFSNQLIKEVYHAGASPYLKSTRISNLKKLIIGATKESLTLWLHQEQYRAEGMDAYIGLKAEENIYEFNDLPRDQHQLYQKYFSQKLQLDYLGKNKWILMRYPTKGMAQLAKLGSEELKAIFYKSCAMDYKKLSEDVKPLETRLSKTKTVMISSPGTDLTFSIQHIDSFMCDGRYNLPDGEIFTAPIRDSVNGTIHFNCPTYFQGHVIEDVRFEFVDGKIVSYDGNDRDLLKSILETDDGASYIGEFGIGLNPFITKPMNNILFDEKMSGSIHLAIGQAFPMADNGNESAIHLDFVLNQQSSYGGGSLYFDEELIRKDGLFVPKDLENLNGVEYQNGRLRV
ncbi:aminopeptidase [Fictibacillus sp. KIGAM418]|uniref:Aminopeptidase n=1 Tax=Fictibacillus marinisediminis TaxID=2878389 RepID=A0A9X2BF32_9BACL|nr:aminopeptidase [Fictibacillus marinisediminis]MCK6259464.1 aminopeptidase [Fictibacillus marinisediminis]